MSRVMEIGQIVAMLEERVESVIDALGLHGERRGREFFAKNPLRNDRALGSFAICIQGAKRGTWADFATAGRNGRKHDSGDVLDLIAYIHFGGDKRRALVWARSYLGLDGMDPDRLKRTRRAAKEAKAKRDKAAEAEARKFRESAWRRWDEAKADILHTPVERYLLGRGIDVRALPRVPRALRHHPALWCGEADRRLPAMVAIIQSGDGKFLGIHRTWLARRPDGQWVKAELKKPKKTLGEWKGGFIRLHRGESGRALSKAPDCDIVMIGEGIEDALTAARARPDLRAIAAISVGNMASIRLPKQVGTVMVLAQNDAEGSAADQALQAAYLNFFQQGFDVLEARVPRGVAKDLNELCQKSEVRDQASEGVA